MRTKAFGLYLHIPFCVQKCAYCDFYSLPNDARKQVYTDALCAQIATEGAKRRTQAVDTVFLGGGTPTSLTVSQLCQIFEAVRTHFTLAPDAEWTMEANPATIKREALVALRTMGLNRLSIGVQSTCNAELQALGRLHTAEQAREAVQTAHAAGIENVSVDLMFGIPYQTPKTLQQSIADTTDWDITHLSLYGLQIEEGTPFYVQRAHLSLPDEDREAELYFQSLDLLTQRGFFQYEISNFAKEGRACRHNLKYWRSEPYLGLGTAAHGFVDSVRYSIAPDLAAYLAAAEKGDFSLVTQIEEKPTEGELRDEYTMLALRLRQGVREADFFERFGVGFASCYGEKLRALLRNGLILYQNEAWIIPESKQYISNNILSDLLDFA